MSDISSQLVHYLLNDGDFTDIAGSIFSEVRRETAVDGLYLFQTNDTGNSITVIVSDGADIYHSGQSVNIGDTGIKGDAGTAVTKYGKAVYYPVYMMGKTAMYVYGLMINDEFTGTQLQRISHMTIVVQSIATRKNNDDSLKYSYKLLEKVLDEVYSGVAVLDRDENDIFFINRMARESEPMQRVIGNVLKTYCGTGDCSVEEAADLASGSWYDVHISSIKWINGKNAILCTALDVTQKVKNLQSARYQLYNDYLTGIFNREKCESDLSELLKKSISEGEKGALIYLDLDDFKQVNDRLGHQYGDVLLQDIAGAVKDIPQIAGSCYRMGGDEFVIIIRPDVYKDTGMILEKISELFAKPWDLLGVSYYCTMSMGIVTFPDEGISSSDILGKADYAMYEAKKGGKNRYLWYKDADVSGEKEHDSLKNMVQKAAENDLGGFETVVRKVVRTDGSMTGTKVLSVPHGCSGSGEAYIMQYAEYMGFASKLGDRTFESACRMAASGKIMTPVYVSVHPSQLMKKNLADELCQMASEYGTCLSDIILEIAEDDEMRDEKRVVQNINHLSEKGFGIGLYNFGKGRMSMERMLSYRVSSVCLCDDFDSLPNAEILKNALQNMSESFGFTICEETDC